MAVIHNTTLTPTKLELLAAWLPTRGWYQGRPDTELVKAGGFRLDDPAGEVGIEFMVVGSGPEAYLVPMTYRGAPLDAAEGALIGTTEHGVLGRRWVYDACHDPVAVSQLVALFEGRAQPQAQSLSDTVDRDVVAVCKADAPLATDFTVTDDAQGTSLTAPDGPTLRLHRILHAAPAHPEGVIGHLTGVWRNPDDTPARGVFAVLRQP